MKESRSWLTPKQVADLSGVTTRTINNYITSGKLSASREDGRYYIDKSEFYRVFPNCNPEKKMRNAEKNQESIDTITSEIEIQYLKEALLDKEKQNDFLKQLVGTYSDEKSMMLQTINIHSRMLENKQDKSEEQELILVSKKESTALSSRLKDAILKLFGK